MRTNRKSSERKGATLIELLVVAAIMLTLAAVSVPTIKPMMESQVTTRAASTVSTYLARAQTRAIATGRSCGVQFEYFAGTYDPTSDRGSASMILRQVEVPPAYSGLTEQVPGSSDVNTVDVSVDRRFTHLGSLRVNRITRCGDPYWKINSSGYLETAIWDLKDETISFKIKFNSIGAFYDVFLYRPDPDRKELVVPYIVQIPGVELPTFTNASYELIVSGGKPHATMVAPVGLPQGSVVDLEFSGTDSRSFSKGSDVTVMFSPTGEIDYVINNGQEEHPGSTLYFLVGRWDRIAALGVNGTDSMAEDGLWNFEDPANFWVTLNPNTGVISTVEVEQPFAYTLTTPFEGVRESRELARNSKRNVGGR